MLESWKTSGRKFLSGVVVTSLLFTSGLPLTSPLQTKAVTVPVGQQTGCDGEIVLDNGDPGYTEGGTWADQTGNYYTAGQSWADCRVTTTNGSWAEWDPQLPASGTYQVYIWHINGNAAADITVGYSGGTKTIHRDMASGFNIGWENLEDYNFTAGSNGYVKRPLLAIISPCVPSM